MTADGGRLSERTVSPALRAVAKRTSHAAGRAIRNAMTVDVEDYFQVQAFAHCLERSSWEKMPRRVESNTEKILTLFAETGTKATFFVLGWIAERHPALVRRIVDERHELASHGYSHVPVREQKPAELRADVSRTKKLLEDIGGAEVKGYRAASFSIDADTLWAYEVLAE